MLIDLKASIARERASIVKALDGYRSGKFRLFDHAYPAPREITAEHISLLENVIERLDEAARMVEAKQGGGSPDKLGANGGLATPTPPEG